MVLDDKNKCFINYTGLELCKDIKNVQDCPFKKCDQQNIAGGVVHFEQCAKCLQQRQRYEINKNKPVPND